MTGRVAYDAYCAAAGFKSLRSGEPLPTWDEQAENIKAAWVAAAEAVKSDVLTKAGTDIPFAREIIRRRLDADDGFVLAYVSNVAVFLMDRLGVQDKAKRDEVAMEILRKLFY